MQRKKVDLSERPKFGPMQRVIADVESAPPDDPVFTVGQLPKGESSIQDATLESAAEFMDTNRQLKDLMALLGKNRDTLGVNKKNLTSMSEQIKLQAAQALR